MNKIKFRGLPVLIGLSFLLFLSCRTTRELGNGRIQRGLEKNNKLLRILESDTRSPVTFKGKKTELELIINGTRQKVRGNIAIQRDSFIAVSVVPAFGYEIARIFCTEDSVLVINRPEKTYSHNSYEDYRKKYRIPVNFQDLQAMFLNELFYYGSDYPDTRFEKNVTSEKDKYIFLVKTLLNQTLISTQEFEVAANTLRIRKMNLSDHSRSSGMEITYDEFENTGTYIFPRSLKMQMNDKKEMAELNFLYGSLVFDEEIRFNPEIPKNYTRVLMY